jgi:hypothetical protein
MRVRRVGFRMTLCTILVAVLGQQEKTYAQLIGNIPVSRPTSSPQQRPANSVTPNIGTGLVGGLSPLSPSLTLQNGPKRYLRGNRSRLDFVGSNRTDLSGFVGSEQALGIGRVLSAAESLRIETTKSANINKPLPMQPAKGLYYPRLEIAFDIAPSQGELLSVGDASMDIRERVEQVSGGNVNVVMSGNTAILRGTVNSVRTAELLTQLLSFEPGINGVKNELVVK